MEDLGLHSHAAVPLNESAWDYLQQNDVVNDATYHNLQERGSTKESRDAWAIKMLRSKAGLATYAELLQDAPEKAVHIMREGYPQLRDELMFDLNKQHSMNYKAIEFAVLEKQKE